VQFRALEDAELGPLEQEMNDLFVLEIQPRQTQIEDLGFQLQVLEEDVLRPLWDAQGDAWAPGGEASEVQAVFEAKYRELDLMQRAIEVDQWELDAKWQNLWGAGGDVDPEFKALEDLRFEKQRELDLAYRFGNRAIEDIWNQINDFNSTQNWGNTDSQIKSDEINSQLQRLYEQYSELQNGDNGEAAILEEKARAVQEELNALYNHGWDPIYRIDDEIDQLKSAQTAELVAAGNDDSIRALIAELERQKASHIANRVAEVAALKAALAAAETETTTAVTTTGLSDDSVARIAELEHLIVDLESQSTDLLGSRLAEVDSRNDEIEAKEASYAALIDSTQADFQALSASLLAEADALVALEEAEEAALHTSIAQFESDRDAGVAEIQSSIDAVENEIGSGLTVDIDAQISGHQAEIDELRNSVQETTVLISNTTSTDDIQANLSSTEERWNGLINEVNIEILELQAQLGSVTVDSSSDARIRNLQLKAEES
jgi:hypothetical protein